MHAAAQELQHYGTGRSRSEQGVRTQAFLTDARPDFLQMGPTNWTLEIDTTTTAIKRHRTVRLRDSPCVHFPVQEVRISQASWVERISSLGSDPTIEHGANRTHWHRTVRLGGGR